MIDLKVSLTWNSAPLLMEVAKEMDQRLFFAAYYLRDKVRERLGATSNNNGRNPSLPGEVPHYGGGRLRDSMVVFKRGMMDYDVGSTDKKAMWLEFGTVQSDRQGTIVTSPSGNMMRIMNPKTGEVFFRKSIRWRGIEERPFLRPTLYKEWGALRRIVTTGSVSGNLAGTLRLPSQIATNAVAQLGHIG